MRFDLNLATHPYEDAQEFWRRWGIGLAIAGVVSAALLSFVVWDWYHAYEDRRSIAARQQWIASLDTKIAHAQEVVGRPENRVLRERSDYLNNLFRQKAVFSWTKVFEDLERVMPSGVHVVSIRPEVTPDNQLQINLSVAGGNRERALELVRKMEESQRFQRTHIKEESSGHVSQTPGEEVHLTISALYAEDALLGVKGARP
jgi:Tfp pilus assembly protein PilN